MSVRPARLPSIRFFTTGTPTSPLPFLLPGRIRPIDISAGPGPARCSWLLAPAFPPLPWPGVRARLTSAREKRLAHDHALLGGSIVGQRWESGGVLKELMYQEDSSGPGIVIGAGWPGSDVLLRRGIIAQKKIDEERCRNRGQLLKKGCQRLGG